jgi:uncharacterized protein GlcG (DUF336 family)
MSAVFMKPSITHQSAQEMIAAAVARARELSIAVVVAVLDESGLLKAVCRMDGAPVVPIGAAQDKAFTALLGLPSGELFEAIRGDPSMLAALPNSPRMALIAGGVPIQIDGHLVGAIGVGGGSTAQDLDCARAGLAAATG